MGTSSASRWAAGRRFRLVLLTSTGLVLAPPLSIHSQSRFEIFKLAPDSPLATDGSLVYAVADDHRTLLVSPGASSPWQPVTLKPSPGRISGLAWIRDGLYLADEASRSIYRVPEMERSSVQMQQVASPLVRPASVVVQGPPLQRPGPLAVVGGRLLVADRGASTVFQIDPAVDRRLDVLARGLPPGPIYLAVDRGVVAITSPEAGEIRQPASFEGAFAQKAPSPMEFAVWPTRLPVDPATESASQKRLPAGVARSIQRPAAAILARGNLYMVDEGAGWVCVAPRQQRRWTKLPPATPVSRPTGLLTLGDTLLVLDGDRGVLERWPLPVPTDVDLGREIRPALEALYSRLLERRALATRRVAWRGALDQTLSQEGLGDIAPGSKLPSIVCALNPGVCVKDQWRTPVAGTILVPDVPIDRVVDLATLDTAELADGRTLGEEVNRRIVSPTFLDYRSGAELIELNASRLTALQKAPTYGKQAWGPYDANNILSLRQKDFPPGFTLTVPTEKQRALVALPRLLLREDGWLSDIRLLSPGFNWIALDETEAKAYATDPQPPPSPAPAPSPCDMAVLKKERADLVKAIHYTLPPSRSTVRVGVVEVGGIDVQHPAFGGSSVAFSYIANPPTPAPLDTAAPTCQGATAEDDHGTAVAGLIASRQDGLAGFAPNVQIVPLQSRDDVVGEELFAAFRDRKVKIFNLSLHYKEKLVKNIRRRIQELDALFVVAAGNDPTDQRPVCESMDPYPAYPVCEGERSNVLVVAATSPSGDGLIDIDRTVSPAAPGSNWNERVVQIAAPGTGYHAPIRGNGYAPVNGTSFAAPLVTATAALLYDEGVTSPWLIKQRIIATADQKVNLLGKVFGGGLLNVSRAVTAPQYAVLSKGNATKRVDLQLGPQTNAISISWAGGSRTLPLANVRRLTKNQTGTYRIVYLDDVTDRLIVQPEINAGNWTFKYQIVDANTGVVATAIVADQIENYDDYVGPVL